MNCATAAESKPINLAITVRFNVSQQVTIVMITPQGNPTKNAPIKKFKVYTTNISKSKKIKQIEPHITLFSSIDLLLMVTYATLSEEYRLCPCVYYTARTRFLKVPFGKYYFSQAATVTQ